MPGGANPPAQTVNIGKGEMKIAVKVHGPGRVTGVSNRSPENLTTNVGVDRTGKRWPTHYER